MSIYKYDKYDDNSNSYKVKITDTSTVQGVCKDTEILRTLGGDVSCIQSILESSHTSMHGNKKVYQGKVVSIFNIDDMTSFSNFELIESDIHLQRIPQLHQTIKFHFGSGGELICTPCTKLYTSDGSILYAKDLKSYTPILGYNILTDGKIRLGSKYITSMEEHSYLQSVYGAETQMKNIAVALSPTSGIFIHG